MKRRMFLYKGCGMCIAVLTSISAMAFAVEQNEEKSEEKKYTILKVRCDGCKRCMMPCKEKAISIVEGIAAINPDKCKGCGDCVRSCRRQAIKIDDSKSNG